MNGWQWFGVGLALTYPIYIQAGLKLYRRIKYRHDPQTQEERVLFAKKLSAIKRGTYDESRALYDIHKNGYLEGKCPKCEGLVLAMPIEDTTDLICPFCSKKSVIEKYELKVR